jgi:DNA replication protein DnaC
MRSEQDVEEYEIKQSYRPHECKVCKGLDSKCECRREVYRDIKKYEACIPLDHWNATQRDIVHNVEVFDKVIVKYAEKLKMAYNRGYGLILIGEPGSGKTTFLCYILVRSIEKGYLPYYTTFARLEHHLKMGFHDPVAARRLEAMLTSSFVAIDDMGKENYKGGDSYFRAQFERILRERYEDRAPTLLATNSTPDVWTETYGASVESILSGKFVVAYMDPGDMRKSIELKDKMESEMGLRG